MKEKAHIYLRVSSRSKVDGDGFPRQRETVTRYAESHSIDILTEFRDEGVSGTKEAFERDGLTDLLVALKANGVKLVLVERADRLARDLMVSEILLAEFRKLGVRVVAADSGTELTVEDSEPSKVLIRQILACVAQFEKSVIVQKLRGAKQRIKRANPDRRVDGRIPYNESNPALVGRIVELRRKRQGNHLSFDKIAETLNAEGFKPNFGKRFYGSTVQGIFKRR